MNIIAFEDQPTLYAGGQERSLYEILSRLARKGNNVKLFYREEGELINDYQRAGVDTTKIVSRRFSFRSLPATIRDLIRVKNRIKQFKADLLYVNQYSDTPFPALLSKITGVPLLVHLRLPCPHYLSRQYRLGLMQSIECIAISEATKRSYVQQGIDSGKIAVLHNGIDVSAFTKAYKSRRESEKFKVITYLGRICPDKGMEVLIDAFRKAYQRDDRLVLQIAGKVRCAEIRNPEEYLNKLKQRADNIPANNLQFLSHRSDVSQLIANSNMLLLPSVWEEPFGRTIVEGMACGVPTLASDIGGIPEILRSSFSDWLVRPGDPEAWAEAILNKIDWHEQNPDLAKRLRTEAVQRFNIDDYINRLITTFNRFLSSPNS